jgi:hypothetical protein
MSKDMKQKIISEILVLIAYRNFLRTLEMLEKNLKQVKNIDGCYKLMHASNNEIINVIFRL